MRPADTFAAAEAHEVGAQAQELREVLARRQHRRRVDDDGDAAAVRDRDHLIERQNAGRARERRDQVGDRRRPVGDRVFQLEGLGPAGQADLDEDPAGDPVGLIVGEPVRALDDDLVAHVARVGQASDLRRIGAGDARRGLQDEAGAGPRGHERRLGAEHAGDGRAGGLVELVDVHQRLRGFAHRVQRFRPQQGAAVARGRPGAVNDGAHAELPVDRGDHARPSSFIARMAASNPARVSAMTSSVWQVPTSARAPLKSTPFRMRA